MNERMNKKVRIEVDVERAVNSLNIHYIDCEMHIYVFFWKIYIYYNRENGKFGEM